MIFRWVVDIGSFLLCFDNQPSSLVRGIVFSHTDQVEGAKLQGLLCYCFRQFIQVDALKPGAVVEIGVVDGQTRIEAVLGEDENGSPVVLWTVAVEVEVDLAEEAGVEVAFAIAVAHDFDEVERLVWGVKRWDKDAVDAEAGLFDFFGGEAVSGGAGVGGANQVKEGAGVV